MKTNILIIYSFFKLLQVTSYIFSHIKIKLQQKINYSISCIIYKLLKFNRPSYLRNRLTLFSELHNIKRSLRNPENNPDLTLMIDFARTECYKNSFLVSGASLWNQIPVEIRMSESVNGFKRKSFQYFKGL